MACMEHVCPNDACRYMIFNNDPLPTSCPKCGAKMARFWDEEMDYRQERYERRYGSGPEPKEDYDD